MTKKQIIGIDLGTTNSLVAVYTENGPELIPNSLGEYTTPSAVGLTDEGELLIGKAAKQRLMTHPEITTARFKRHMGTRHSVELGSKSYRAEELSSLVLRSLKKDAEAFLKQPIDEAIISVPAYFNHIQRKATVAAAQMAGLRVNRLINEPTAAALAYGAKASDDDVKFLVVDMGGGTFDVSIMDLYSGVMEVRASAGDAFLGGEDFTDSLSKNLAEQLDQKLEKMSKVDQARLRDLADRLKHELSEQDSATGKFVLKDKERSVSISREAFEALCQPIIKRLTLPIQRVMSDARLRSGDLQRIITVGGATRMHAVRAHMTRLFGRFPEHSIDPDHVVALGAAVQTGLAMRHEALEDLVMTDVAPFTLGYETSVMIAERTYEAGHFSPLIERNTIVPVSRSHVVTALEKGQKEIDLRIYQGEAPFVRDNVKIGQLRVKLPINKTDFESVDIRFTYDTSGVLEVLATVLSNEKTQKIVIEGNPGALSKEDIEKRFKELEALKVHPREKQENTALMSRLQAKYENSLGDQRAHISSLIVDSERALATQDDRNIGAVREQLTAILDEYDTTDVF